MLSYAYQTLREADYKDVVVEDFENIHDLLAAILLRGIGNQIRRGLYREYIPKEEALTGLRGRICITESIKQQTLRQRKLICSFDEFTEDTPHNRILKTTMLLLLRHGFLKSENKKGLRKLLLFFGSVSEVNPLAIRWDTLQYHRNNASYRMLINICYLVIKGLLLTTDNGGYRLTSWLDDDMMYKLYERFVRSYYKVEHSELSASAAQIDWDLADGEDKGFLPAMQTDITLSYGLRTLIIDTKWYSHTMLSKAEYCGPKYISANLYQIYTYVKNKDRGVTGNIAGALLYAKTDEENVPDSDNIIGGNRISVKTLDLDREWSGITAQLEELCAWLKTPIAQ